MIVDYIVYGLILLMLVVVLAGGILLWPKGPDERLWGTGPDWVGRDEYGNAEDALPSGRAYGDDHGGKEVPSEQAAALGGLTTAALIALLWSMTAGAETGSYSLAGALVRVLPLAGIFVGLLVALVVKPGDGARNERQVEQEQGWSEEGPEREERRRRRRWVKRRSGV